MEGGSRSREEHAASPGDRCLVVTNHDWDYLHPDGAARGMIHVCTHVRRHHISRTPLSSISLICRSHASLACPASSAHPLLTFICPHVVKRIHWPPPTPPSLDPISTRPTFCAFSAYVFQLPSFSSW